MSVVSVWTSSKPRVEVRTVAQAISECGRRLSDIVLLPRQVNLLAQPSLHRLWLTGPMGSGKTLMLQLKGRQWLKEGKRVVVINVRIASRGRPQGHVLEQSIRRDEASGTGSVERHDIALSEKPFESLQRELAAGGPTDNACFVVDEVLGEVAIIAQKLADHYPHCPIWCVATYAAPVPNTFQCSRLGAVLRSPPSVQLMLKELDLIQGHKDVYTTRSAARGLPCDGPPVLFIEHSKHDTHVRHLDCRQCADELADIFQNKLGLTLHPPTPAKADHSSTGLADVCSSSASVQPSANKIPTIAEAVPLSFRDVLMLVVLPFKAFRHIKNYHWEGYIPEMLQYAMCMCSCQLLLGLRQRGVPLKLVLDNTLKEVAFPPGDEAIITEVLGAHSLERKVIVLLRPGPPLTPEEVTEHIARYQTIQAGSGEGLHGEMKNIQKLLETPPDSESLGIQLHLFASLMNEMCDILYPQVTIPPSPTPEEAKAIFHRLLGNMLVGGTQSLTRDKICKESPHSQPTPQDASSSTELRRGMEYRCVSSPLCDWLSHDPGEGTEVSPEPQVEARGGEGVPEADSAFFVPDLQEDMKQRQGEVQRIREALKSMSDDDMDWEFFAASRCLSQYITILP